MRPTPTMPMRAFLSPFIAVLWGLLARCRRRRSYLRLEQGRERFFRIGQLARVDRHPALDQAPRHRHLALGVDAPHIGKARPVELEQYHRSPIHPSAHLT